MPAAAFRYRATDFKSQFDYFAEYLAILACAFLFEIFSAPICCVVVSIGAFG